MRIKRLNDFIGQDDIKQRLKIIINSAVKREDSLGHCLFLGLPGLGKTTLAKIIANELNTKIYTANGAALRSIKNIAPYIMRIKENNIFFIDEIHRTTKIVQEFLYPIMEDYFCVLGRGNDIQKINIPTFTLIGATTDSGLLTQPLKDRFKHHLSLSLYNEQELLELAKASSFKLDIELTDEAFLSVIKRARGTPRILNKMLEWLRDYAVSNNIKVLTLNNIIDAMNLAKIDKMGLTSDDRKYISYVRFRGPVSLQTIAAAINVSVETVENDIEPYLIRLGLIKKTTKGRILDINSYKEYDYLF